MFHTSTPVTGEGFESREVELATLERAITRLTEGAPQWVAILGPRKIGKTSLVLEAVRRMPDGAPRAVTMDAQEWAPLSLAFFRHLALRVADAFFVHETGESLARLADQPAAYRGVLQRTGTFARLPAPLRAELLELASDAPTPERVRAWLDLPERLSEALGLRLVVALDEFQELAALTSARKGFDVFAVLRSVWQRHRHVAYFISGSARSMLLSLVNEESSPFFHHFTILELGPFARDAATALLRRHAPPEQDIPKNVAEQAVATFGCHPFYLQMLGEELTAHRRVPDVADLKAAVQALLFSTTGRLALFLENEYNRCVGRSTHLAASLDALAEGPRTLTAVATRIQAASGATATYLDRLKDAVRRNEAGTYELSDPTFALWLRWRRPGGAVVPMSVIGDQAERAVAQALSSMGFDLVYQSRASRGAFDLLATRGAVQVGLQVKRSPLPLRFTRAEWSRMAADARRLGWHWVVAAMSPDEIVTLLDPALARHGREVRLDDSAALSNLPRWVDVRSAEGQKEIRT